MSLIFNTSAGEEHGGSFYNEAISQSARFGANNVLTDELDAPSDRKNFTLSMWFKRCRTSTEEGLSAVSTDGNYVRFEASGAIRVRQFNTTINLITNAVFRDTSTWYHLVVAWDLDNGTQADRVIIYVNGTRQTLATNSLPANTSTDSNFNQDGQTLHIGSSYSGGVVQYFDGYIADVNFVDGTALAPTSFGETKNGVWIPITPTGLTYGNNGFRLQFANSAVSTASSSTIGADTSGKDRHFTSAGIDAWDCAIPDSPEDNFCIMGSSSMRRYGHGNVATMAEGGLLATSAGNATHAFGTMSIKQILANGLGVYFEMRCVTDGTPRCYFGIVAGQENNVSAGGGDGTDAALYEYPLKFVIDVRGTIFAGTQTNGTAETNIGAGALSGDYSSIFTVAAGDVMGVAIKSDGKVFISKNGTFVNSLAGTSNPATGANPIHLIDTTLDWFPINGYSDSAWHANFGQDGSFSDTETSGGETDSNGIGDFFGAVPSGFVCLSTLNMAEPLIGANSTSQAKDHTQAVIYEGDTDGTDGAQNIAVNFKPDLTWIKNRDATDPHQLFDSSRGPTFPFAVKEASVGETANDDTLTAFIDTGFTLGDDVNVNTNDESYVSWNWKANAAVSTGSGDESGDNPKFDHQSNTLAGFSIVEYEGTGANGTFAHGVQVNGVAAAPACIWFKHIQGEDSWAMWHHTAVTANSQYIPLNTVNGLVADTNLWNTGVPSTTIINLGTNSLVNRNLGSPSGQGKFVCYCFAEIEGYSKFGVYHGNNAADGTFVYTGFRPSFVLTKRADGGTGNWYINDTARSLFNSTTPLYFNLNNAESGNGIDILSNGFKIRNADASQNADGIKYLYMAFAEESFKYANAR